MLLQGSLGLAAHAVLCSRHLIAGHTQLASQGLVRCSQLPLLLQHSRE
jgi:hypothetical protein